MLRIADLLFKKQGSIRPPDVLILAVAGREISVVVRRNPRAQRMTLRMQKTPDAAVMSIPKRTSLTEARGFAERSVGWIEKQLSRQAPATAIAHAAVIPLRGEPHTILATGKARGLVAQDHEAAALVVPGTPEHMPRRLTDWLKVEAKRDLETACMRYAAAMNVRYTALGVRDQKSRWGSCNAKGALSFSWRLILAPHYVLDYVAAHEVAHLKEMNHGPRFWRLVLTHCPHTRQAKAWLKSSGAQLHRIA
jgi:predicted metal-dependent hydrolase